jgi:hypothetical protein
MFVSQLLELPGAAGRGSSARVARQNSSGLTVLTYENAPASVRLWAHFDRFEQGLNAQGCRSDDSREQRFRYATLPAPSQTLVVPNTECCPVLWAHFERTVLDQFTIVVTVSSRKRAPLCVVHMACNKKLGKQKLPSLVWFLANR